MAKLSRLIVISFIEKATLELKLKGGKFVDHRAIEGRKF